jgi:hypothetical protein
LKIDGQVYIFKWVLSRDPATLDDLRLLAAQIEVMRVVLTIGYRAGFLYPGRRERARTAALDELARKRGEAG